MYHPSDDYTYIHEFEEAQARFLTIEPYKSDPYILEIEASLHELMRREPDLCAYDFGRYVRLPPTRFSSLSEKAAWREKALREAEEEFQEDRAKLSASILDVAWLVRFMEESGLKPNKRPNRMAASIRHYAETAIRQRAFLIHDYIPPSYVQTGTFAAAAILAGYVCEHGPGKDTRVGIGRRSERSLEARLKSGW